jgi:SAM-dependent methyltransferase
LIVSSGLCILKAINAGERLQLVSGQRSYWDRVATEKMFTHPLSEVWLNQIKNQNARILDYGCGYGRILNDLKLRGFTNTVGVDFFPQMIARGKKEYPSMNLRAFQALPLSEVNASFDVIFLFAVLTCIPDNHEQEALLKELQRVLRPGGILYVSDMPLQTDDRNRTRYANAMAQFETYGVFETEDGAMVRHHPQARFDALLDGFEILDTLNVQISTMNGNPATGLQILARLPEA